MKRIDKILKFFLIFFIISVSLLFIKDYNQNKLIYLIYSLSINYLFIRTFFINFYFCEFFISLFLWLSFWFSFSIKNILHWSGILNIYPDSRSITIFSRSEGVINSAKYQHIIDDTLMACTFIFVFIAIMFSLLRKIIQPSLNKNFFVSCPNGLINFYDIYKKNIIFSIVIITLVSAFLNFNYSIYQKGILSNVNLFLIDIYIKWAYLIGLPIIYCLVLFLEINSKKCRFYFIFFIIFLLMFLLNITLMSRAMIMEIIPILLGTYFLLKFKKDKFKRLSIISVFALLLSIYSITLVDKIRTKTYFTNSSLNEILKTIKIEKTVEDLKLLNVVNIKKDYSKKKNDQNSLNNKLSISKAFKEIIYIFFNRWVGIDGVILVMNKKDILGLDFFTLALKEKKNYEQFPFFERNFIDETKYRKLNDNNYGIILPGFIAFSLYLKNFFLIFFLLSVTLVFLVFLEKISEKIIKKNYILISFVSYIVSYRFIHFGYVPRDSYLMFGALIFTLIIFIYLIKIIIKKNY